MRKSTDLCLLCQEKPSDKKNSHLIPKFFGKGIFEGTHPRHGIQMNRSGEILKVQDIIKVDFILCSDCEKGLSVLETYCALRLERFNNLTYYKQFNRFKRGDFQYFECNEMNIKVFNLFIYSIVWRLSADDNYAFKSFKLLLSDEEMLRQVIKNNISISQSCLIDKLDSFTELPSHSHVLIRPTKKLRPPSSMLSASMTNESVYQLYLIDYIMFYITDKEKLVSVFHEIDNNTFNRKVRIGLTEPDKWTKFNSEVLSKLWK